MIKCISCKHTRVDKDASDSKWDAYECGNPESDYYKALLNTTPEGGKLKRVSWSGRPLGERKVK